MKEEKDYKEYNLYVWYDYKIDRFFSEYSWSVEFIMRNNTSKSRRIWKIGTDLISDVILFNGVRNFVLEAMEDPNINQATLFKFLSKNFTHPSSSEMFQKISSETFSDFEEIPYISSVNNF